ncbi:MAG: ACP S-malonyltransferase [Acidimicrobiales bacterium]
MTIAFTFPGQGSQKQGMGAPWVKHPSWELVAEASRAADRDVERLLLQADADELKATQNAQLATYVLSLVILDAVERLGAAPALAAGHSLGEYSALTAAGVIAFEDGVRLVAERGEAMRLAGEEREGAMAAVLGLDDDQVEEAAQAAGGDVWVANYNAPGQVVIAGTPEGVDAAAAQAKARGAKRVMPVPVSGAFHTPLMAPARERLRKAIASVEFRDAAPEVFANVDAAGHTTAQDWPELLGAQLTSPVRWRQTLYALADRGVTTFVELGPGTVLTGMAKRTISGAKALSVSSPGELDTLLESLAGPTEVAFSRHEGEHLFASERLVVAPAAGVFTPVDAVDHGQPVRPGDILGTVNGRDVRSQFAGVLMGLLADQGERVTASQPIAWLRTA